LVYPCFDANKSTPCPEHSRNLTNFGFYNLQGHYASYGKQAFIVDLSAENASVKLTHLRKNAWLDQFTRALALRLTGYSAQQDRYFILTVLCESPMGSGYAMRVEMRVEEMRL
jgi:hypothetical protein